MTFITYPGTSLSFFGLGTRYLSFTDISFMLRMKNPRSI